MTPENEAVSSLECGLPTRSDVNQSPVEEGPQEPHDFRTDREIRDDGNVLKSYRRGDDANSNRILKRGDLVRLVER